MHSSYSMGHRQEGAGNSSLSMGRGKKHAWRVIHACEYARDVLAVVEGQIAEGMRPYIVTPQGEGRAELFLSGKRNGHPRSLSLLRSWQDVRHWRKSLLDCAPETEADLVHAHGFTAGMAAVRSCSCVVYDFGDCIEDLAISSAQCEPGSWMARSFRVAEQFVLTRAAAVIVHSHAMQLAAVERGAAAEDIFVIPAPVNEEDRLASADFLVRRFGLSPDAVSFFVPQFAGEGVQALSPAAVCVLEGFALAASELPQFDLLLEAPESARKAINEHGSRLGISARIFVVHELDVPATMQCAGIVVEMGERPTDPVAARRPSEICLKSLWQGKALLAADVQRNRDASPDGRGCLWFEANNPRDLGYRMAFLGRRPEFRLALAAAGRMHIFESRMTIGKKYDEAYRHAFAQRKSGTHGPGIMVWRPEASCG